MSNNLVSIVIPAYNGEKFIADAITSATEQTYSNTEIIVYDDGSTDKTADIVKSIPDKRIQYRYSENEGLTRTLNKAISLAQGTYICWLNQDDIFLPEKVTRQAASFEEDDTLGAVFCMKHDINEKGEIIDEETPLHILNPSAFCPEGRENILLMLFQGCFLSAPSVMIKKNVLDDVGLFNEGLQVAFDYDMWFRIIKLYNIKIIKEPLLHFRHHDHNLSKEKEDGHLALLESCLTIMNALETFHVEDLFPELKHPFPGTAEQNAAYAVSYMKWARFIYRNAWWRTQLLMSIYKLTHKALSLNPLSADAYELATDICRTAGLTKQERYYHKKYTEQETRFHTLLDQMETALKAGEQEKSLQFSNTLFSIFPEHPDTYARLYNVFKEMGKQEEAEYYRSLVNSLK